MNISLDDSGLHLRFAPLSLTRPVGNLRIGILTNDERWKLLVPDAVISFQTESYLEKKFPKAESPEFRVNASVIPDRQLVKAILELKNGEELVCENTSIAKRGLVSVKQVPYAEKPLVITQIWDLFQKNGEALKLDFAMLTEGRKSQELSQSNTLIGDRKLVFLEEGASVEASVLNTTSGPVYIGKNAELMEGCMVRGPFALGEGAGIKMGAKIYGPTSIGPHCKVGGEISNVLFQSYSNKGHDGFLGNSLIGEWCNLGADTNSSNLKNNYSKVAAYSYETKRLEKTEIQFMGLIMGDHSKCGINTMFNTATSIGVSANIFGAGFPPKYIPSFFWGGADGFEKFELSKAIEVAQAMMGRREVEFGDADRAIFEHIFESTGI